MSRGSSPAWKVTATLEMLRHEGNSNEPGFVPGMEKEGDGNSDRSLTIALASIYHGLPLFLDPGRRCRASRA